MMDEKRIQDYLLGRLSEDAREEMERRFFEDDDLTAEMLSVEEHLIESYLSGTLDATAKKQFEATYGSTPSQQHEVRLHKLLRSQDAEPVILPKPVVPARRTSALALAACIALLALGVGLLFRENRRLNRDIENIKASQQQLMEEKTAQKVPPPQVVDGKPTVDVPVQRGPAVPAVVLFSGIRTAETAIPVVKLPGGASLFVLQADLAKSDAQYRARVENVDGAVLYEVAPLSGASIDRSYDRVSVPLPAHQLPAGDYILTIQTTSGRQTGGQFYFRLIK